MASDRPHLRLRTGLKPPDLAPGELGATRSRTIGGRGFKDFVGLRLVFRVATDLIL